MLTGIYAHPGHPVSPDELGTAWNLDPVLLLLFALTAWLYARGWARISRQPSRRFWFVTALVALAVALVSPLEALADALASAHMVQHVLILLVAAPMLALAEAPALTFRGLPRSLRKRMGGWRRRLGLNPNRTHPLRHPTVIWLLAAGTVWFWHAAGPYDAALQSEPVHQIEHATFLLTSVLFWGVLVAPRHPNRPSLGYRVLLVFTMATQGVLLAALITFAETPWYSGYTASTAAWGLTPLADQQLGGVIMWIPSGPIYTITGLVLLVRWIHDLGGPARYRTLAPKPPSYDREGGPKLPLDDESVG